MSKTTKSSTAKKQTKKPVFDEYIDMRTLKTQITTMAWAERVATEMTKWVEEDPEAFKANQFWRKYHVAREDYMRLVTRYPVLKQAYEYTLMVLGDKRELGAAHVGAKKLWEPSVIMPSLGRYDPDLRAYLAWKEHLKANALADAQSKFTNNKITENS